MTPLSPSFDSSGNFRWADDLGGSGGNDSGLGIAYDSSARPYVVVSGSFTKTMNFYPSIPTAYLQQPIVSAGGTDGFAASSSRTARGTITCFRGTNQTESWAEQIGGPGNDAITAVAASGSGYSFTGYFSGTANLNPHPGFADEHTSAGGTDGFVMQVNSLQGYRQYLTTFGGTGDDQGTSIAYGLDSNNSNLPPLLFVGGSFEDTVDFSGGAGTGDLTSAGGSDAFVARYNASTGALDWVRSAGSTGNDATNALAVAYHGVAAAGSYTGTVNFASPSGTFDLNDAGQGSAFLWSLDANGNLVYARGMGGSQPTQALGVAIGLTGYTFVGGQFQGTADFNQGFGGTAPMTAGGTVDGFVAKFQDYFDMVPIAENDTFIYAPGGTLNVEQTPGETLASGFLADDLERDGLGGLVPQILTYPTHGTLSPGFYGDFTYTPNAGFTGTDSFTYQAVDISVLSNVATVTLVSTGPVQDIEPIPNLTMYPGQSTLTVVLVAAEGGSQANYSYSAQTTTQVPVTLAVNQYGVLTITPQAGYSGTFGVTASVDGSSETFNVHVVANTPPTLPTIANQSTPINTPLTLTLAATDPDEGDNSPAGQTLTYSAAIVGSSPPVTLGIVLNQLTITPATGYEGTFTVQASVTDGVATIMKSFQVSVGASTASFVGADTSTKGNWIGVYGKQGYNVLGSTELNPASATLVHAGPGQQVSTPGRPQLRRQLRRAAEGSTVGVYPEKSQAVWYSPTSFTIDVNVAAGNSYDLELYFLDYDAKGRAETVTLSDANTSVVLNTQTVSNFANGEYLSWAISGNVLITITRTAGANGVVSGLFFDPLGTLPPPPTATASFVGTNTSTQGTWIGTYGAQGYDIVSGPVSLPSGDTVTPAGQSTYTWTTTSSDPRALQVPGSSNRVAAVWYASTSFTVAVNLGDGLAHNLELYFDDWDNKGRAETVQLSDAGTGKVLDTETISAFNNGVYLDWKVSGNLLITITRTAGANAVLNGLFLDGTTHPASATFLQKDTTTQGSWMGTYGAQGYDIVSGPVSLPSGDTVTPAGQSTYTWTTTSSDPRALQVPSSSNRVAAVWYAASTSFTVARQPGRQPEPTTWSFTSTTGTTRVEPRRCSSATWGPARCWTPRRSPPRSTTLASISTGRSPGNLLINDHPDGRGQRGHSTSDCSSTARRRAKWQGDSDRCPHPAARPAFRSACRRPISLSSGERGLDIRAVRRED